MKITIHQSKPVILDYFRNKQEITTGSDITITMDMDDEQKYYLQQSRSLPLLQMLDEMFRRFEKSEGTAREMLLVAMICDFFGDHESAKVYRSIVDK